MEENFTIPSGVLSDLCSRFIINVPEEERSDLIRIFFQIEIAHWFYLDFYCDSSFLSSSSLSSTSSTVFSCNVSATAATTTTQSLTPTNFVDEISDNIIQQQQAQLLKPCSIRTFAENIFRHCPFLMQHTDQVDDILSKWKTFKHAVPTNGAIILDETMKYVLLVQGFWAKASWGFPKGKVVEEETEAKCAIREVLEETGYDISNDLKEDEFLEIQINDQTIRLYIITNVSKMTKFEPRTRREIKEVRWFAVDELPVHRKDLRTKQTLGYSPNSFFMVIPFLKALKQWISVKRMDAQFGNSPNKNNKSNQRSHSINHQRNNSHHHHSHSSSSNGHHNNHHHHHHSHHSNGNGGYSHENSARKTNGFGYRNKQISKSNDSISSLTNFNNNNNSYYNNNINNYTNSAQKKINFSKQQANSNGSFTKQQQQQQSKSSDQEEKQRNKQQQSQYYQKLHQNEFAELLSFKEAALANKTNKLVNSNSSHQIKILSKSGNGNVNGNNNSNSKFKPINQNNENANTNSNSMNNAKMKLSNSNGNSNNTHSPNNIMSIPGLTATISINQQSTRKQQSSQNLKELPLKNLSLNNTNNFSVQNMSFNKVKKQLEFNGPECWINFKFDYDSIFQSLPPLLDL